MDKVVSNLQLEVKKRILVIVSVKGKTPTYAMTYSPKGSTNSLSFVRQAELGDNQGIISKLTLPYFMMAGRTMGLIVCLLDFVVRQCHTLGSSEMMPVSQSFLMEKRTVTVPFLTRAITSAGIS